MYSVAQAVALLSNMVLVLEVALEETPLASIQHKTLFWALV